MFWTDFLYLCLSWPKKACGVGAPPTRSGVNKHLPRKRGRPTSNPKRSTSSLLQRNGVDKRWILMKQAVSNTIFESWKNMGLQNFSINCSFTKKKAAYVMADPVPWFLTRKHIFSCGMFRNVKIIKCSLPREKNGIRITSFCMFGTHGCPNVFNCLYQKTEYGDEYGAPKI